jgi:hypothetical protein
MTQDNKQSLSSSLNAVSSQKRKLTVFDSIFIGLILLLLGTAIFCSRNDKKEIVPFSAAVLFGSAISLLTYYYLGGINKDEASVTTGLENSAKITLGGSIAALVGTTLISNFILEQQMNPIALDPNNSKLLVVDQNGKAVELKVVRNAGGILNKLYIIGIKPEEDVITTVAEKCQDGLGFCAPKTENIKFEILNGDIAEDEVRVCQNNKWVGRTLTVSNPDLRKRNNTFAFKAKEGNLCEGDPNKTPILIGISETSAKKMGVKEDGQKGWAQIQPKYTQVNASAD